MRAAVTCIGLACLAALLLAAAETPPPPPPKPDAEKPGPERNQLLAPDGVPYDNEGSFDLMKAKPLTGNLIANGSFEAGRYWPQGWQPTDGLTTFWIEGGTHGKRCLKIYTDVLEAQWQGRDKEVRAALEAATQKTDGKPQSLPKNPIPDPPERVPTSPPYYDTVAGIHGVHYRSDYVPCVPGAIYRFSIDAKTDGTSAPRVFIKGFFDREMKTEAGIRIVRQDAYRAPMILDPCDDQWRRYAREFHPSRSKSTLGGKPLKTEWLQVQIYAYWRPDNYYFDNVRLDIIGTEVPPEPPKAPQKAPVPKRKPEPRPLPEDEFPVFNP